MLAVGARTVDAHDDVVHVVGDLGHDDDLCARRDARIEGDVAAVAAHHFDDGDALVRIHRITQLVDDFEAGIHRRIEAQRIVGIFEVVVDGAGDADRGDAVIFGERLCPAEGAVAADDDEAFDAVAFERLHRLLLPVLGEHFEASRRAQLGAAALHDIRNAPRSMPYTSMPK